MKNLRGAIILTIISFFVYSCDDENGINELINLNEQIVPGVLSSMQIERINCNLTSAIINVEDNEIKNIN